MKGDHCPTCGGRVVVVGTDEGTQHYEPFYAHHGDMPVTGSASIEPREPCRHDSSRVDGTLDAHCLLCGADGYWHDGHRHDQIHPSGKTLISLACEAV